MDLHLESNQYLSKIYQLKISEDQVKYLDLHLDQKLTWKQHIKSKRQQINFNLEKWFGLWEVSLN